MSYVAMHFVKVNGRMYTEGEIIDTVIDEGKRERLLKHGAIRKLDSDAVFPEQQPEQEEKPVPTESTEEVIQADEITSAPEIDIMDGIVGAKKTRRRRTK